jgi:hypothetical protein
VLDPLADKVALVVAAGGSQPSDEEADATGLVVGRVARLGLTVDPKLALDARVVSPQVVTSASAHVASRRPVGHHDWKIYQQFFSYQNI